MQILRAAALPGASWQSSFAVREIATVTMSLAFRLPFENIMNDKKQQCLTFLIPDACMEDVQKTYFYIGLSRGSTIVQTREQLIVVFFF